MKLVCAVLALIVLNGCASTAVYSDGMQPDGSYRILAGGNVIATQDDAKAAAYQRAEGLCPNGFDTKSEMGGNQGVKPMYQLIVKCR